MRIARVHKQHILLMVQKQPEHLITSIKMNPLHLPVKINNIVQDVNELLAYTPRVVLEPVVRVYHCLHHHHYAL